MKTSTIIAAIRCAAAGRNAVRGKFGMGRLVRMSDLSLLHRPVYCSIAAGKPLGLGSSKQPISRRMPASTMSSQDSWRERGDSRSVRNHITLSVMPSQENQTFKATALA